MARKNGMEKESERKVVDPLWYKNAVIYEVHVRAFYDREGDGIGDFRGLCDKLDYLQDLGITAIWLLPFYPSPLRDDGYDIADYCDVHPSYGTLKDFRLFLKEAHRRELRVITELVINHTSSDHPWFQRARRAAAGSSHRNYYVWSDTPERYSETRIIFKDFETSNWTWDPVAKAYYWHRFYSHQPDLNFDNPAVHREVLRALDFWLGMGVDGLRLDAVPYLYQREGTNCENLPETHAFLKKLRRYVDSRYPDRMLLAEANQWPEDAVEYFGEGDECHMAFHFPLMPRMFMALQLEDRFPVVDILEQTPEIPETSQWALFLRNHDELTLEMVTDEDRDYMYRMYAHDPQARINLGIRRRLAPLLQKRRKLELMNALLFSLPGTPVIYYADEIGMGDNIYLGDRNGVRTPMQWSCDRNAGFSRANPQKLYLPVITDPEYHYEALNVEAQQTNPHSILWWMKRLISLRKQYPAFGCGSIEFLHPENGKVLAFIRAHGQQRLLVVANTSRFVQYVELDLSGYRGLVPVEMFGNTRFPRIRKRPYFLTLGPHGFYWFVLVPARAARHELVLGRRRAPRIEISGAWTEVLRGKPRKALEELLPAFLKSCRWFGGKSRQVKSVSIADSIPLSHDSKTSYLLFIDVFYQDGRPETYLLPLAFAGGERAREVESNDRFAVIARLRFTGGKRSPKQAGSASYEPGCIYDALSEPDFCRALLGSVDRRRKHKGELGSVQGQRARAFRQLVGPAEEILEPRINQTEQSNTSVIFGDRVIMKVFRRIQEGTSPDLEMSSFLDERFDNVPRIAGSIEYRRESFETGTLAMLQAFVANQGDAWQYTLNALGMFFERALASAAPPESLPLPASKLVDRLQQEVPDAVVDLIGYYLPAAELLGRRSAEMHLALASARQNERFAPEPFTALYQQSLYQSIRTTGTRAFQLLWRNLRQVPQDLRAPARCLLDLEGEFFRRLKTITARKTIKALRIRCHGDYHLGQVLYTGSDFVIIDFEGEPAAATSERRLKRSALRDVAGMLRSFHYAAITGLDREATRSERPAFLDAWAELWTQWVSQEFMKTYIRHAEPGGLLPADADDMEVLLDVLLLEKAAYELQYELNNRPDWLRVPLQGLLRLLGDLSGDTPEPAAAEATEGDR
jgi:maltose alpha-D-glucosyltransferase/alpha-amylase